MQLGLAGHLTFNKRIINYCQATPHIFPIPDDCGNMETVIIYYVASDSVYHTKAYGQERHHRLVSQSRDKRQD
jgi:hypothetical protein